VTSVDDGKELGAAGHGVNDALVDLVVRHLSSALEATGQKSGTSDKAR
jgi:hypothetical protein